LGDAVCGRIRAWQSGLVGDNQSKRDNMRSLNKQNGAAKAAPPNRFLIADN
jgi:hypothetical protein